MNFDYFYFKIFYSNIRTQKTEMFNKTVGLTELLLELFKLNS
jgi:hypothetical protein